MEFTKVVKPSLSVNFMWARFQLLIYYNLEQVVERNIIAILRIVEIIIWVLTKGDHNNTKYAIDLKNLPSSCMLEDVVSE